MEIKIIEFNLDPISKWQLCKTGKFAYFLITPFMYIFEKWRNIHWKSCNVRIAKFLKYVWLFFIILHETVNLLYQTWSVTWVFTLLVLNSCLLESHRQTWSKKPLESSKHYWLKVLYNSYALFLPFLF